MTLLRVYACIFLLGLSWVTSQRFGTVSVVLAPPFARRLALEGLSRSEVVSISWDPCPREPVEGVIRATSMLELAADRANSGAEGKTSVHGGYSLAVPSFHGRRWSGLVRTRASGGFCFGVLSDYSVLVSAVAVLPQGLRTVPWWFWWRFSQDRLVLLLLAAVFSLMSFPSFSVVLVGQRVPVARMVCFISRALCALPDGGLSVVAPTRVASRSRGMSGVWGGYVCRPSTLWRSKVVVLVVRCRSHLVVAWSRQVCRGLLLLWARLRWFLRESCVCQDLSRWSWHCFVMFRYLVVPCCRLL
ncbi:hypothetical protein Taro_045691 [Colocasia esculenta]|uniref:Uncharacterized protein n=1 Tax=Colocasia esculenta TaxID=4460 RepID=A0A843WQ55_COLES|nr:hypothetical protein [Colocasia esculenta]